MAALAFEICHLQAQDPASAEAEAAGGDKWEQIQLNNKQMTKNLDDIEENIKFVRIRVMQSR